MLKIYCRIYQGILRIVSYFLPWCKPKLVEGENSLNKLPKLIKNKGIKSILIVTDRKISSIGLMDTLLKGLIKEKIEYYIYDKTISNPTIDNVEKAIKIYKDNKCKGIIGFGGGSPIDCAKGVGARIVRPKKNISKLKGQLKVKKKIPPLFAVPTTAGTGSEATIAAVITDSNTHEKYAINDIALIPDYAVLDPLLTINLPKHITATTGLDALTHAVEAYIGKSNTKKTKEYSKESIKLIFENLYKAYIDGTNIVPRANMQKASYLAGIAFTRAYVGYVHAIAHTIGGLYSVPHGLANAIILPYVLEYYGKAVYKPLSELADLVKVASDYDNNKQKATKFINEIKKLNESMNIPKKISEIKEEDIPLMVKRALKEANPLYPVPKIFDKNDMFNIYKLLME
ncbi:MAG: iron-containing alcohol dehydrogenase [Firmicutes bacterium]|nr:iron-containing alcohol dehydrogenase [Bacillota bacterium]